VPPTSAHAKNRRKGDNVIRRLALLLLFAVSLPRTGFADSEAAARKHATRANKLAAQNKCRSALPEFTRAYQTLKDPTLLFNRAECQRKLGNAEEALKDYQQFLTDMPTAPNRASVEEHIATLRATVQSQPPASAPAASPASTPDVDGKPEKKAAPSPRAQKWE
jgi:tetratricopeptide (TPR) repeat protein